MRVFAGALCCFLLIQIGTPVRDGFQPLPLRPQDQIKGIGKIDLGQMLIKLKHVLS